MSFATRFLGVCFKIPKVHQIFPWHQLSSNYQAFQPTLNHQSLDYAMVSDALIHEFHDSDAYSYLASRQVLENIGFSPNSALVKPSIVQEKVQSNEGLEEARGGFSSGFDATEPTLHDSAGVYHSISRRMHQNSKDASDCPLETRLSSVIKGFHDKSAFERFETANRGTSSDSMTSEHALHGSEVVSRFPPQRTLNNLSVFSTTDVFPLPGSTDMQFLEHPENNSRKKATANPIFSSARADLQPEVSPSPSCSDVGNLPGGGPNAGLSFEEPLGEVTFSVASSPLLFSPLPAVPVTATPARRPLISASAARRLLLSDSATSARRRLQHVSASEGRTNAYSRDHQLEAVPDAGLIQLQDNSLFHLLDFHNLSAPAVPSLKLPRPRKQPTLQRKVSSLLFAEPCLASPTDFSGQKPARSSIDYGFSSQEQQQAVPSHVSLLAERQEVQQRLRRAPPRATQRRSAASAATVAEDGRRRRDSHQSRAVSRTETAL